MARQSTAPVQFNRTVRADDCVLMTSGRAGRVVPMGYIPLLPMDSASGRVGMDVQLGEMPRPLLNAVTANFQAWFVPKSAHPQFTGRDELQHAWTGEVIKSLGAADRPALPYYTTFTGANVATAAASEFCRSLGLHIPAGQPINSDLIDAFAVVYNFRLAAHSSKLTRRPYAAEDLAAACTLPRAFWPSSRMASVVPDYERALVVGSLDLDILSGRLPVSGLGVGNANAVVPGVNIAGIDDTFTANTMYPFSLQSNAVNTMSMRVTGATAAAARADIWAEMAGKTVSTSLADIDKARTTQAFAKLRTAYAGNDASGFDNDDTLVAMLMQGIAVQAEDFKRPRPSQSVQRTQPPHAYYPTATAF